MPSVSRPAAPAAVCRCRPAVEPGSWATVASDRPAGRRRSLRRYPPRLCCASLAPALASGSHVQPQLPSTVLQPPGVRDRLPPRALRSLERRPSGLHPSFRGPSSAQADSSAAWLARERPLYWPLLPFRPSAARRRLLCRLLTSALRSDRLAATSVSHRDAAQTSRGKTDRLRRTPAGFTTPAFDDCGLCDQLLARPAG